MATKAPVEIRSIAMLDGRVVDFPGKRRLQKTSITAPDGSLQVRMDFENGESRLLTLAPDMIAQYALHGAEQKLGDEISGITGIDDCVEAVDQLMDRLNKGDWTKEREGGGASMAGASILAKSMVEFTKQPVDVVRTYLGTLDAKTKAALRVSAELAPIIQRLEAEKAARAAAAGKVAPTIDVTATLAGLLNPAPPANSVFPTSEALM